MKVPSDLFTVLFKFIPFCIVDKRITKKITTVLQVHAVSSACYKEKG